VSEREIVCEDLNLAIDDLKKDGFRVDVIYPADDPSTALMSRDGASVRVTTRPGSGRPSKMLPPFAPEFVFTPAGASPGEGRAGMFYRDLIPSRLGGRYIASHITIPEGGPVSDWVHYHHVALQVIMVVKGWVRVVYEDQGEPFVMNAGDLVLQPPGIRHRVLESSPGLEVVEISAPAVHETWADHEVDLPNVPGDASRQFGRQRFLRHIAAEGKKTALVEATDGIADVKTIGMAPGETLHQPVHDGELVFGFVIEGSGILHRGEDEVELGATDAFAIPPKERWRIAAGEGGLRLLHFTTSRPD
jgi:mannose-6-phosphate isomerase-like protein (cupin superfamily)